MRVKLELALKPLMMAKAKENMKSGGGDKKSGLSNLTNPIERSITRKQIADSAGVSEGTVHNVETVLADGIEDVKADMLSNRRGRDRMASLAVAWKSNAMTSNFNADRAALGATVS